MRRTASILGVLLIAGLLIREIFEFFGANEGIHYFSSQPRRLLYLMLVAVVGGVIAFGIRRLSPDSQRMLKLLGLGTFGALLACGLGFFAYLLCILFNRSAWWVWEVAAFVAGVWTAGMVWMEFRRVWRQTR